MNISFCTTATCRPGMVNQTYSSFAQNLKGVDLSKVTMYLNVDPCPSKDVGLRNDVIEVAKKYFGNVVHMCPKKPNPSAAVNWLWTSADSDYLFLLEDDWTLIKPVDVPGMLRCFEASQDVLEVRLRWKISEKFAFGLSPGIVSRRFYKHYAGKFSTKLAPEPQLREGLAIEAYQVGRNLLPWPSSPEIVVKDTGREWREKRGITLVDSRGKKTKAKGFVGWNK